MANHSFRGHLAEDLRTGELTPRNPDSQIWFGGRVGWRLADKPAIGPREMASAGANCAEKEFGVSGNWQPLVGSSAPVSVLKL